MTKSEAKELVRSKIRDLSRFEPDEATVSAYTTWICSGGGGRSVFLQVQNAINLSDKVV